MKLYKELAAYLVWSLQQQGFRAEAFDTGERIKGDEIHQIRVWADDEIHLIRRNGDYHRFRCKYILNARKEHHRAISDLIDSVDPTKGWGPYPD